MKKTLLKGILLIALIAALLCVSTAFAEDASILGRPFPDFTAEDADGNAFTLSETLKDHEAAVINFWATWCPPCRIEFPFLNEAYQVYGDRVAFLCLSIEQADTAEVIRAFREEHGLSLPMGRDENYALYLSMNGGGSIPVTVVVDRFGNAVFTHEMCFRSYREIASVLDAVLGEDYTESAVLDEIPLPVKTAAFPVGAQRAVHVENEHARRVFFRSETDAFRLEAWVVNDRTAYLRIEAPAADDPYSMVLYDSLRPYIHELPTLLDPERGAYVLDLSLPGADAELPVANVCLYDFLHPESPDVLDVYLIPDESCLETLCTVLQSYGYEMTEGEAEAPAEEAAAYVLHVTDQYGAPVPGLMLNFCTDTACVLLKSDENGLIIFEGAPDTYHVQLLKAPEGYSFDPGFELYTPKAYGEWLLRVRKD
ncbi:MAG: TlpA family protein disulfide reductase [Clostridia bacterium]|nr:TlpA family protein disulfide reductase [Clostridia bacterium]